MTVVAIALLVVILLIIGIIFIPFTYEFKFSSRQPYMVDVHALWGFKKVIYAHFRYEQGRPFLKEVILMGKNKLASKEASDKNDIENSRIDSEVLESKNISDDSVNIDTNSINHNTNHSTTANHSNSKETNQNEESKDTKDTEDNKKDTNGKDIDKMWWVPHVKQLSLYRALLKFVRRCYNHSKPRSFYLEGLFGTGDPCQTGILAGLFYAFCPERMEAVEFNFIEPSYEGSGYLKGKIVPAFLMWYGLCLICAKPIRRFIWAAIKFIRVSRKKKD